jgi:hypothetical protein
MDVDTNLTKNGVIGKSKSEVAERATFRAEVTTGGKLT